MRKPIRLLLGLYIELYSCSSQLLWLVQQRHNYSQRILQLGIYRDKKSDEDMCTLDCQGVVIINTILWVHHDPLGKPAIIWFHGNWIRDDDDVKSFSCTVCHWNERRHVETKQQSWPEGVWIAFWFTPGCLAVKRDTALFDGNLSMSALKGVLQ